MEKYLILLLLSVHFACGEGAMDPPNAGTPSFTMDPLSVEEGDELNTVNLILRLTNASETTVSVTINTNDNTAKAGEDYIDVVSERVEFSPGETSSNLAIEIIGDDKFEQDESFIVKASGIVGATLARTEVEVIIENDDAGSGITIPKTGYSTPEEYSGMQLLWSDEFTGIQLDASKWSYDTGNTDSFGNAGWGNNELQYYRIQNTSIVEGHLVIQARNQFFEGFDYTSSRIITKNKFDFKYGRVDIRAVLPTGKGMWPALWMLGTNLDAIGWPACGEIDIVEILGFNNPGNEIKATIHWADPNSSEPRNHAEYGETYTLSSGKFDEEFHVYSAIWSENEIKFLVDDMVYFTVDTSSGDLSEFRQRFFLIFNIAVGGDSVGPPDGSTIFPKNMIVDYVRVFQDN